VSTTNRRSRIWSRSWTHTWAWLGLDDRGPSIRAELEEIVRSQLVPGAEQLLPDVHAVARCGGRSHSRPREPRRYRFDDVITAVVEADDGFEGPYMVAANTETRGWDGHHDVDSSQWESGKSDDVRRTHHLKRRRLARRGLGLADAAEHSDGESWLRRGETTLEQALYVQGLNSLYVDTDVRRSLTETLAMRRAP